MEDWVDRIKHGGRLDAQVKDFFKVSGKFEVFCTLEIIVEWICEIPLALYYILVHIYRLPGLKGEKKVRCTV